LKLSPEQTKRLAGVVFDRLRESGVCLMCEEKKEKGKTSDLVPR